MEFTCNDGVRIKGKALYIQHIGNIKIRSHRPVDGIIKTAIIKRQADRYYACFSVKDIPEFLEPTGAFVGLDMDISNLVTTSDGQFFAPPKYLRQSKRQLRRLQRKVARRQKRSNRRRKTVLELQRLHQYIANLHLSKRYKYHVIYIRYKIYMIIYYVTSMKLSRKKRCYAKICVLERSCFYPNLGFPFQRSGRAQL